MKVTGGCFLKRNEKGEWEFFVRAKSEFISKISTIFGNSTKDQIELMFTIKRFTTNKTLKQLGYYYGALVPGLVILYEEQSGFKHMTEPSMDSIMRIKYMTETIYNSKGDMIEYPIDISDSTKDEMSMLIDQVREIEYKQNFGVEPPDPEEYKKGVRINNYGKH